MITIFRWQHEFSGPTVTYDSRQNMATWNAEQVLQVLNGEWPPRAVNPDVWPQFVTRFERILGRSARPLNAVPDD